MTELADIFNSVKSELKLPYDQWKVVNAVTACRTARLGGHLYKCSSCNTKEPRYNSCRNRHCPKCLGSKTAKWLEARKSELLDVPYFHIVFTVPHELNPLIQCNKKLVLNLMFKAVSETFKSVAKTKLKGEVGYFTILHTWGQKLEFHPHIHCVVPGVVIKENRKIKKTSAKFFLPVKILQVVFKAIMLRLLKENQIKFNCSKTWIVYAKKPFKSAEVVLKYLSSYTHRIAISNKRILKLENNQVSFSYKDYKNNCQKKQLTISATEFSRRFLLHVNPHQFVRIRYYGFLAANRRGKILPKLKAKFPITKLEPCISNVFTCHNCQKGNLIKQYEIQPIFITHRLYQKFVIPPPGRDSGFSSTA